AYAADMKP
ncbi:hypothetical protein D041_0619B, partial [Vibrio parahaemolyticus EKP-008]